MPRSLGMEEWVRKLGERIGAELGQVIAKRARRTIETSIDVEDIARRLGGRRARAGKAACSEPGCGNRVLAKGLCRSHYYRARYRAQKAGALIPRGRKRRRRGQPRPAGGGAGPQNPGACFCVAPSIRVKVTRVAFTFHGAIAPNPLVAHEE